MQIIVLDDDGNRKLIDASVTCKSSARGTFSYVENRAPGHRRLLRSPPKARNSRADVELPTKFKIMIGFLGINCVSSLLDELKDETLEHTMENSQQLVSGLSTAISALEKVCSNVNLLLNCQYSAPPPPSLGPARYYGGSAGGRTPVIPLCIPAEVTQSDQIRALGLPATAELARLGDEMRNSTPYLCVATASKQSVETPSDFEDTAADSSTSIGKEKTLDLEQAQQSIETPPARFERSLGRWVTISGLRSNIQLSELTPRIRTGLGPLVAVKIKRKSPVCDASARLLFLHNYKAAAFVRESPPFAGVSATLGKWENILTDMLSAMVLPEAGMQVAGQGKNVARRRITIAGHKADLTESKIRMHLRKEAGITDRDIETIELVNSGTAHVVFADIAAALKAKQAINRLGTKGKYGERICGIATFSRDPSE